MHGGTAYVFYMDIRAGAMYDEFVRRAIEEDGVQYVRGRVSRIYEEDGKLVVKGADTLLGHQPIEIKADMVVLATAMVASKGAETIAQTLKVSYDPYYFLSEAHPKLKPVETNTAGIFVAGACQAPKDIPGRGAGVGRAAKVGGCFSSERRASRFAWGTVALRRCIRRAGRLPVRVGVRYLALAREEIKGRVGKVHRVVARVNPVGAGCPCVALCRSRRALAGTRTSRSWR